jgi:carbon monoxide dehydrogenase subunit G
MEITVSRDIAAPPASVWDVITNVDRYTDVLSGVQRVERLDAGTGFGVGTRWRETRTMFGREATEEMGVTAVDPGTSYTVSGDSRGTTYTSTFRVEAAGDGRSRVTMTFGAVPSGAVARVLAATLGRLFVGASRKALQQDLDDIGVAAESGLHD